MKLTLEGIKNAKEWEAAGITLPSYDIEKVVENTKKAPVWVHFGAAIPMGILYVIYEKIIAYVMEKFHMLGSFLQFLDVNYVFQYLLPVGIGLGIGIGFIGSIFSVRKHLRV